MNVREDTVQIVNGLFPGWEQKLEEAVDSRRNFLLILDDAEGALTRILERLRPSKPPDRLERWGVYGLHDALDDEEFQWLLNAEQLRYQIYFFEQLFLPQNRPPRLKRFLVYCEVRGILSEHETEDGAYEAFHECLTHFGRMHKMPLAGLYAWQKGRWEQLRRW